MHENKGVWMVVVLQVIEAFNQAKFPSTELAVLATTLTTLSRTVDCEGGCSGVKHSVAERLGVPPPVSFICVVALGGSVVARKAASS